MADISKINNHSIKDATARANHSALVEEINDMVDSINAALENKLSLSGGTLTGALTTKDLTLKGIEQFQTHYAKKLIGTLSAGTSYANLDSKYKDGTYHRMWRLRFPASCNFWGKIKITLYGGYSSFNASGIMSKSITCNFNGSSIYNNVGFYDGLGVNVEKDFRISEAIWNSTASAWEILIWQKNLSGNNSPTILIEAWSNSETHLTNAKNITAQAVELTQATTYTASKASSTGGTKTVTWATTPVYETPLGEEIATMSDIPSVPSVTVTPTLTTGTEIASIKVGSTTTKLYAPTGSGSVSGNYLPLSGGTMTGDITYDYADGRYRKIGFLDPEVNGYIEFDGGYGSLSLISRDRISLESSDVYIKGLITAIAPSDYSGDEKVTAWFNTANGGRVGFGKEATNSGTGIFFDQVKGTRRLNFFASSTAGGMVWEQPESGSCLYYDVGGIQFRGCSSIVFNKFKSAGYLYTDSSGSLKKGTMPTSLKNPKALTFGSKTYDGSTAQTITASDIGANVTVTQKLTSGTEIGSIKVGSTTTKLYAPEGSTGSNDEFVHIKVSSVKNYGITNGLKDESLKYVSVKVISGNLKAGDLIQICQPQQKNKYNRVNGAKTNIRTVTRMKAMITYEVTQWELDECADVFTIKIDLTNDPKAYSVINYDLTPDDSRNRKPRTVRVMRPYVDSNGFTRNKQISNGVQLAMNDSSQSISII